MVRVVRRGYSCRRLVSVEGIGCTQIWRITTVHGIWRVYHGLVIGYGSLWWILITRLPTHGGIKVGRIVLSWDLGTHADRRGISSRVERSWVASYS